MKPWILALVTATLIVGCTSEPAPSADKPADSGVKAAPTKTIAFVSNNAADFWTIARKGTEKAQAELPDFKIEFQMPADASAAEQKRILDDLVAKGVKGIALSPVDPKSQTADLNALAEKCALFTQDSDAPDSKRACYVGTDNVAAGVMAGEEVKKALPQGGKIMVFVGKADAQNAKERFEGLKKALEGTKVVVLDLRTDDGDKVRAKQNVADTLVKTPDVAGLVGLWGYNGPAIASAVKEAGKAGKIQIVCFDEEPDTLAAIKDGTIRSTIVQQPYEFGYQSMMMLAKYVGGDKSVVPADHKVIVPTKVIEKATVEDFETKLKELRK